MNYEEDGYDVRSLAVTFRSGARLERHSHPWGQLVFASSGVMRIRTDTAFFLAPPTKAVWVPAGLAHQIEGRGEVAMRTLYIAPRQATALSAEAEALEVAPLLRELILHILRLGMLAIERPADARLAGLLIDLLLEARREDLALPLPKDPRALYLALRLQQDPSDRRELGALARDAGASLRTLQRAFPRETGLTLEGWRQKARLISAIAALSSGDRVEAAALACGYQGAGAFITAFRLQFGITPGRYFAPQSPSRKPI